MNSVNLEIWKDIEGYEGLYKISNKGNVLSLYGWNGKSYYQREKILVGGISTTGYRTVWLSNGNEGKRVKVHRLVASAFIPKVEGKNVVNHKDGNPLNNNVENLEWCTQQENVLHAIKTGLTPQLDFSKEELTEMVNKKMNATEIAEAKGICRATVSHYLKKYGLKLRTKYEIALDDIKRLFANGWSNSEIAEYFGCPNNYVARRRYQFKKGEI